MQEQHNKSLFFVKIFRRRAAYSEYGMMDKIKFYIFNMCIIKLYSDVI